MKGTKVLKITIDESGASAEASEALRALPGYAEFLEALKSRGRQVGIDLVLVDRAQQSLVTVASRVAEEASAVPEHDMPPGTWVVRRHSPDRPSIGRVADAYVCMGELSLDIVLYQHDGTKIGRESPAMGGPRGYEPACGADNWEPIETPDFDLLSTKGFWGRHVKRLRESVAMGDAT